MRSIFELAALLMMVCIPISQTMSIEHQHELWHEWKKVHAKRYTNEADETRRLEIWKKNLDQIQAHNVRHDLGLETYLMGTNQFTDLTYEEFRDQYLCKPMLYNLTDINHQIKSIRVNLSGIPDEFDWRDKGAVTEIKDQGDCGSCWAFSAIGALEGQMGRQFGKAKNLSVQQLIDCGYLTGNAGCDGGTPTRAFDYAIKYGMMSGEDYPYIEKVQKCQYSSNKVKSRIYKQRHVKPNDEDDLLDAVYEVGPTSVGIDANDEFMKYKTGIFTSKRCSKVKLSHSVVAIGFGKEKDLKYWILKNAYGTRWGELGYMKIGRNMGGMCGIAKESVVPMRSK